MRARQLDVLTTKVEQQATERDATASRVEQLERQVADLIQMNLQLKASNADKDERLAASVGGLRIVVLQ